LKSRDPQSANQAHSVDLVRDEEAPAKRGHETAFPTPVDLVRDDEVFDRLGGYGK